MILRTLVTIFILFAQTTAFCAQEQKIEVFPNAPYEHYIIYQALIFFWIGIAGLIVIIAMKLRELRRIQDMGVDGEEKDVPFLD